ncbi:MAG: ATP-binding protein [Motiliproteus sp.]
MSDVFVFAEDDEPLVEQGGQAQNQGCWKVLIVDDDESVHQVTKLALKRTALDDKPLEFISAFSGEEAKKLAVEHDDIALILLDIVMETDRAGFEVANYIRHELDNHLTRIILRTGQPGDVPEKDVILNYEIDGYKTKSELTSQALFSVILTSLRSYRDLQRVAQNNQRLDKIVAATGIIFEQRSVAGFLDALLLQLQELLPLKLAARTPLFFAAEMVEGSLRFLSGSESILIESTGIESSDGLIGHLPSDVRGLIIEAQNKHHSVYRDGHLVLLGNKSIDRPLMVYFSDVDTLDNNLWHMLDIFSSNFETAFANLQLSIENEQHRKNLELRVEERTRQLSDTQDRLFQAEKLASIGQLAAGVAHEINNPLGFIKSNFAMFADSFNKLLVLLEHYQTMETHGSDDQITQLKQLLHAADVEYLIEELPVVVDETGEGINRIRRIVSDLRDFTSLATGDMYDSDLNQLLQNTLRLIPDEKQQGVDIHCDFGLMSHVYLMPEQFGKAIYNIMQNAFESMPEGGKFRVSSSEKEGYVEILFEDSGRGISEDKLSRIFDPFYTTKGIGDGTGLGLSLCYGVVKLHGGRINVESELGEGTKITIRLPVRPDQSLDSAEL